MRLLIAMFIVFNLFGVAMAQEELPPWGPEIPKITEVRLLSSGGPTVLFIGVNTPFKQGLYRIKTKIFNSNGEKIGSDDSGWFAWTHRDHIGYESQLKPRLKGSDYFLETKLLYAPKIHNER